MLQSSKNAQTVLASRTPIPKNIRLSTNQKTVLKHSEQLPQPILYQDKFLQQIWQKVLKVFHNIFCIC